MTDLDYHLDAGRVAEVRDAILKEMFSHYRSYPPSRRHVFEVLGALANATQVILKGTDYDRSAREFFDEALCSSIKGDCDS